MRPLAVPDSMGFPFILDDDGIIWRFHARRYCWNEAKPTKRPDGYCTITWNIEPRKRKFMYWHRVVWALYGKAVPPGHEINHINMDKSDNRIENLELVSHGDNIRKARVILGNWSADGKSAKLKPHQRALVLLLPYCANWRALAERWGVHKVTLLSIRANRGSEALVPRQGAKMVYKTRSDKGIPKQTR